MFFAPDTVLLRSGLSPEEIQKRISDCLTGRGPFLKRKRNRLRLLGKTEPGRFQVRRYRLTHHGNIYPVMTGEVEGRGPESHIALEMRLPAFQRVALLFSLGMLFLLGMALVTVVVLREVAGFGIMVFRPDLSPWTVAGLGTLVLLLLPATLWQYRVLTRRDLTVLMQLLEARRDDNTEFP